MAHKAHTVKAVSAIAGVSVRTLHHYDQIGLLKPATHSASGYRLYGEKELERLQQILFFRELGFDLKEIKKILGDRNFDRKRALLEHRKLLIQRQDRLRQLIGSVDRTLKSMQKGTPMNAQMFEGFDASKYEEEARQRWGNTPEFEASVKRAKSYTKQDWDQIKAEGADIMQHLAALIDRDPADKDVQKWIARHHGQINERFYHCTPAIYRGLANAYVDDPRFASFYEKIKPGLAKFMRSAMLVYSDTLDRA